MITTKRVLFIACVLVVVSLGPARAAEPNLTWEYATPKYLPMAIIADQLDRPFLYVALKDGGLRVLDSSNPKAAPRELAKIEKESVRQLDVMNLAQSGKLLFMALGGHFAAEGTNKAGMAIVSVADPRKPKLLSVWESKEKLKGGAVVVTDGKFAYLGAMSAGVMTFDVSDPSAIKHLSTFQPDIHFPRRNPGRVQYPNARGLAIRGDELFVAYDAGGLRALDVSDRERPREIGRYINEALIRKQQAYNNILIDGNTAYIAIDYAGLEIVDIANPRKIRQIGRWNPWDADTNKNLWFNSPGHTNQLALDHKRNLVYLSAGDSELMIVDVADPHSPKTAGQYGKQKNKLGVWGMTISKDQVYLTYIKAFIPFRGTWTGIKAVTR